MRLYKFSLLFFVLLFITGCTQVDDQIILNDNGTALREILVTIDKSNESYSENKVESSINQVEQVFTNNGYKFEIIEDNEEILKLKLSKEIKTNDQKKLQFVFNDSDEETKVDESLIVTKKDNFFYAIHNTTNDLSISYLKEKYDAHNIDYRLYLTFPEKVYGNHNAQAVINEGKTLAWRLPVDKSQKIDIEVYTIDSGQVMLVGGPVVGILLIALYLIMTNKEQFHQTPRREPVKRSK